MTWSPATARSRYTSLFAQARPQGLRAGQSKELRAAERAIVTYRFGGSRAPTDGALARAGATRAIALGVSRTSFGRRGSSAASGSAPPSGGRSRSTATATRTPRRGSSRPRPRPVARPSASRRRDRGPGARPVFRHPGPAARSRLEDRHRHVRVRALGPTGPLGASPGSGPLGHRRHAHEVGSRDQLFDNWLMNKRSARHSYTTCRATGCPRSARWS